MTIDQSGDSKPLRQRDLDAVAEWVRLRERTQPSHRLLRGWPLGGIESQALAGQHRPGGKPLVARTRASGRDEGVEVVEDVELARTAVGYRPVTVAALAGFGASAFPLE